MRATGTCASPIARHAKVPDQPGTGASDPVTPGALPTLEQ
jgi:hypothetical protein